MSWCCDKVGGPTDGSSGCEFEPVLEARRFRAGGPCCPCDGTRLGPGMLPCQGPMSPLSSLSTVRCKVGKAIPADPD
jgi:hypothetical protein